MVSGENMAWHMERRTKICCIRFCARGSNASGELLGGKVYDADLIFSKVKYSDIDLKGASPAIM